MRGLCLQRRRVGGGGGSGALVSRGGILSNGLRAMLASRPWRGQGNQGEGWDPAVRTTTTTTKARGSNGERGEDWRRRGRGGCSQGGRFGRRGRAKASETPSAALSGWSRKHASPSRPALLAARLRARTMNTVLEHHSSPATLC